VQFDKDALRRLMTDRALSPVINVSPSTLRRWRKQDKGPPFRKFGPEPNAPVRYDPADVAQWIASLPRGGQGLPSKARALAEDSRLDISDLEKERGADPRR
jgi:hypothetical protein